MLTQIIEIAKAAGQLALKKFKDANVIVNFKSDRSVYTAADLLANDYICQALTQLYPHIPIISEEAAIHVDDATRSQWDKCFLVDPLDGSKEFIQGSPEFTVNIALIHHHMPILGVIHAPALDVCYYAEQGHGAYKQDSHKTQALPTINIARRGADLPQRVIVSRSHLSQATTAYLNHLKSQGDIETLSIGSALKFGLIAEGLADLYPRFSPTMEWDTAAGQIIVNEVGKKVYRVDNNADDAVWLGIQEEELHYNKPNLLNPSFIVR